MIVNTNTIPNYQDIFSRGVVIVNIIVPETEEASEGKSSIAILAS